VRAGEATELTARVPVQVCRLADQGSLVFLPGGSHRMGNPGHLLFESAVALAAPRIGRRLCGVRDLGPLPVAPTADVGGGSRAVSRRCRVVDLYCSLA
jgi:hypothetical protein